MKINPASEKRLAGNCSISAPVSVDGSWVLCDPLKVLLCGEWQGWEEQEEADFSLQNPRASDSKLLEPRFTELLFYYYYYFLVILKIPGLLRWVERLEMGMPGLLGRRWWV